MFREDAEKYRAKSYEEYRKRNDAVFADAKLKDGERRIIIRPGFDLQNTEDRRFGQGNPTLIFAERRGDVTIDCSFGTGWNVVGEPSLSMDGRDISMMGYGFYYHRHLKKDVKYLEYAHEEAKCPLLDDRKCYGEAGSALYGDVLKWKLLNYGETAIWEEIDREFKEYSL